MVEKKAAAPVLVCTKCGKIYRVVLDVGLCNACRKTEEQKPPSTDFLKDQ